MIDGRKIEFLPSSGAPVEVDPNIPDSFARWTPRPGPIFEELAAKKAQGLSESVSNPHKEFERWREESIRVAGRCVQPSRATGTPLNTRQLVVGRVQSGKTTNFTAVMALLADNGYYLFVVVAGTTIPLLAQTRSRLRADLGSSRFRFFSTGDDEATWTRNVQEIKRTLRDLERHKENPHVARPRRAICITVLKWNQSHLDRLVDTFKELQANPETRAQMLQFPALLVDDECDSFSLNSNIRRPDKEETAIYQSLVNLQQSLPVCSYLGYTATPMANQLQDLDDQLKPQRVTVLEPGSDYMGLEHFFHDDSSFPTEIKDWGDDDELPVSLKEAMGQFLVRVTLLHHSNPDVAARFMQEPFLSKRANKIPSMLVHVSRKVEALSRTSEQLMKLVEHWIEVLSQAPSETGSLELQTEEFLRAYVDPTIQEMGLEDRLRAEDLIPELGLEAREMAVRLIVGQGNEGASEFPTQDELEHYRSWVFVGGQLLDRGQTLPQLLVTYLARESGGGARGREAGGNIDTLLQRARFLGYQGQYRKLLKGYFSETSIESFKSIIPVERLVRSSLRKADTLSLPFADVPAVFALDARHAKLKWTRKSVTPLKFKTVASSASSWMLIWHRYGTEESKRNAEFVLSMAQHWAGSTPSNWEGDDFVAKISMADAVEFVDKFAHHPLDEESFAVSRKIMRAVWESEATGEAKFRFSNRPKRSLDTLDAGGYRTAAPEGNYFPNSSGHLSSGEREKYSPGHPTIWIKFFRFQNENGDVLFEPGVGVSINLGEPRRYLLKLDTND